MTELILDQILNLGPLSNFDELKSNNIQDIHAHTKRKGDVEIHQSVCFLTT